MKILRSASVYLFAFFTMLILLPLRLYVNSRPLEQLDQTQARLHRFVRLYARTINRMIGIKIRARGVEHIPEQGPVLFIGNHQSYLDIPIFLEVSPLSAGFLAKEELGQLPLFGGWVAAIGSAFLSRDDDRQALRQILDLVKRFQEHEHSLVVFPEGTRTVDGRVGEYKAGAFRVATRSKTPVVPFAIRGSYEAMPKGSLVFRPRLVDLVFFPAIPTDKKTDTVALAKTCERLSREFVEDKTFPIDAQKQEEAVS